MPNRLAHESSPYLRQHADNPVDWYPWGDEARAEAKRLNRPLLISIGYAACHWCHVMAHESFEDPEVAAVMNDHFVNVKVDREERPDVDAVYMEATQAMTGSGGWPMTVFATPDGEPFYCGTYFPPRGAGGRPGFMELCLGLAEAYAERPDDVRAQADQIVEHLRRTEFSSGELPTMADVDNAVENLKAMHSAQWGGFGTAPKFPQPMAIDVLLDTYRRSGDDDALSAAVTSLDAMAAGGIYDHLGGGFARYSVDNQWLVPHFEKMLYDQAQLVRVYTHAWQLTGLARHRQVVTETIAYVLRDLRHAAGGFFSSEDADSEGVEGKFSVWTPLEIADVLGDDTEATEAALGWWGVTEEGNFEGHSILNRIGNRTELLRPPAVERARVALLTARGKRVRPGLDDKVLTEWNAMMIGALTEAAMAMGESAWLDAAVEAATFLVEHLHDDDRGWLRSWQAEGGARHLAYASDHATLVDAFTRLGEATGDAKWADRAVSCAEALLDRFADHENGGFFTTAHDAETLIARPKAVQDNPIPSENSAAAVGLLRLGALKEDSRFREAAIGVLRLTGRYAGQHPTAFGALLTAVPLLDIGVTEVTVSGSETGALTDVYWSRWRPYAVLHHESTDAPGTAMVCRNSVCDLPVSSPEALATRLDG